MGYRHYFIKVEKSLVESLRDCKNIKEVNKVLEKYNIETEEDYISIRKIGEVFFEFGKYYDNAESIIYKGENLFYSKEMTENLSHYMPIIGGKELILDAIEWQKNTIIKNYESLLNNDISEWEKEVDYKNKTEDEIMLIRLKRHVSNHLNWWKPKYGDWTAINTDLSKESICESWLYEHTIFELVRLYKSFDDEKYCLMFVGW